MTKPFIAGQFAPTPWSTAQDKADFANHLIRFITQGYKRTLFHKWFYQRLSQMFGHIAHYSQEGFYAEFFRNREDIEFFHSRINTWRCYGQVSYTWCDVERAVQVWLISNGYGEIPS